MMQPFPWRVLLLDEAFCRAAGTILLLGAFLIIGKDVITHIVIRRRLLSDAYPVPDNVRAVYDEEAKKASLMKPIGSILVAPAVKTPLAIGVLRKSMCLLLPERSYTDEELSLIFRHELIHIERKDSRMKLAMLLLTALQWYNPFMWIARTECAKDMELACDEAVLYESDEEERRRYASLLLRTEGDARGFTTCMSASAKALKYRLERVIEPVQIKKQLIGYALVTILTLIMVFAGPTTTVAYGAGNIGDVLKERNLSLRPEAITDVYLFDPENTYVTCADQEALSDYLESVPVYYCGGRNGISFEGWHISMTVEDDESFFQLMVGENEMEYILFHRNEGGSPVRYYIPDGTIDWEYIVSLMRKTP